jgi:ribosomal protein S18 acetylase RimI-like enzyme
VGHANAIADWIFETRPAAFGFLFADYDNPRASVKGGVCRSSAEFAGRSAIIDFCDNQAAGMPIAFTGDGVARRRRADLVALISTVRLEQRLGCVPRLQSFANFAVPLEASDYYIRSLAVDSRYRRLGISRKLLERVIDDGTALGFRRFRLDIESENGPANTLYNSVSFTRIRVGVIDELGLEMSSLLLKK